MVPQSPVPYGQEILPPLGPVAGGEVAIAAAGMLHDLGNLVQIATSALNILARTPDMPVTHREPLLHRARTSLDHAGTIIHQNMAQASARTTDPYSDVAECLADVVALVAGGEDRLLRVVALVEPGLPALACDPIGLRRALLNLVLNARDAMGGQGTVWIEARALSCAVSLSVRDHGAGMSPATLARVFDPFFTTKRDGLGGIGLPMVERFARSAGGGVSIESEAGTGTIVTLRLPAAFQESRS